MTTEHTNPANNNESIAPGIHVVAKPMGPVCNLACEYCFYLEKKALFGDGENFRMSDEVLSAFVADYIASQPTPVVEFVWQGGEPTLMGLDFFKKVVQRAEALRKREDHQELPADQRDAPHGRVVRLPKEEQLHGGHQPRRAAGDPRHLPPRPLGPRHVRRRDARA